MFNIVIFFTFIYGVFGYFTLPGKCPENVGLKEDFRLAEFYNNWYQSYFYSSDGHRLNNCSVLNLVTKPTGVYLNQSRVDRGLFHRYSIGRIVIPSDIEKPAFLDVEFKFDNAPRRQAYWHILNQSRVDRRLFHGYENHHQLHIEKKNFNENMLHLSVMKRKYPFRVLATNYNYYATVYTCEYSPLIDKHFIYVWILSRTQLLNDVSFALATKPLQQIGVDPTKLVKEEWSKCQPKYYEDQAVEPVTFRYPVPV